MNILFYCKPIISDHKKVNNSLSSLYSFAKKSIQYLPSVMLSIQHALVHYLAKGFFGGWWAAVRIETMTFQQHNCVCNQSVATYATITACKWV